MSGHDVALLIHLLLFVYRLGGDIGVFYSSGLSVNRSLSREARQMAGKIMINLDLIPRLCLSLMLTVGGILTEYYGIDHPIWQWVGIILLGPVWFCALVYMHFNEGSDLVKKMTKVDYVFRWVMVFTLLGIGLLWILYRSFGCRTMGRLQTRCICRPDLLWNHD